MIRSKWNEVLLRMGRFLSKSRSTRTVKRVLVLLFSSTLLISTYLLSVPFLGKEYDYNLGDVANQDIRVPRDIRYTVQETTEKLKQEAYEKERLVFDRDYQDLRAVIDEARTEFRVLESTANESNRVLLAKKRLEFLKTSKQISNSDIREAFAPKNRQKLVDWANKYATLIFEQYGFLKSELTQEQERGLKRSGALVRTINSGSQESEDIWDSSRIIYRERMFDYRYYSQLSNLGEKSFREQLTPGARELVILRLLQLYYQHPTLEYNAAITVQRKKEAAASVTPVTAVLEKGQTIVRAGDPIDQNKLQKIQILNRFQRQTSVEYIIGMFIVMLVLALGVAFYIFRYSEFKLRELSSHVILHSLILTLFLFAFFLSRFEAVQELDMYFGILVPVGYATTMMGILFGARVTLVVGVYISVFLYLLSGEGQATLLLSLVATITGVYAASRMERRNQFFKGAWVIGLANLFVVLGMDLLQNQFGSGTQLRLGAAFLNGYVATILTTGILPVYETLFNLPTKFRLMELSDFNHPLLRKLAARAPSTYTHSLMMANMSERAISAIGANSLLTKVGCLYHDIGKMLNPSFYTENKHLSPQHEKFRKLGPLKSAQTIIAHVTDGVRMGREHRLPERIISFIPEHHGTTTMQFFYHQALEEAKKSSKPRKITKAQFQYPGPKPASKETGVVMLADSVEAASRSLRSANREEIEELIDRIFQNKMSENQFDNCPLTLSDLRKVKDTFIEVLMSSYHLRPQYPSMEDTQQLEAASKKQSEEKEKSAKAGTSASKGANRSENSSNQKSSASSTQTAKANSGKQKKQAPSSKSGGRSGGS